ncbi:MAG TPA: adenylate/guanylate cyclase domain-containing protein, partial [Candidatus Tectomicrobia bacterium]|nr:adenylate/guanylate cyclase domain-containing protein [Candidatus Tectomicrobia bacterium]
MAEPDLAPGVPPLAYTPRALAERILSSRAGIEGERKHVTILFADVKDSMELIARRDAEEARRLLDPVLEIMMDAVHRYEGMVNQVMGDGVMAIFGAPLAYEDHAVRACYAALVMRDGMHRYAEQLSVSHGVEIKARIGINSGEVVVRAIGSDLRMDYTAVGQATHLAARMEQLAAPETICLTAETLRLAEPFVRTRPLGPTTVRGVTQRVEIFELLGAWPTRTPWQARVMRGLIPFVGRAAELGSLRQAARWTEAGHGQLVGLVGEPGIGKSRLAWEFATEQRAQGWLVVETAAISYGRTTAFRPLTDLLRAYFELDEHVDPGAARTAITRRLQALDETLIGAVPAFLDLMRLPFEDAAWAAAEPAQRRERIQKAVRNLVLADSRARPVLLLFEDLHWVDSQTQGAVDHLVEILPAARVMVLATYRPEYRHSWASRDCFTELHVDALITPDADRILQALLGDDPGLLHLKRLLMDRTEGNPFFLEECVRALVASGALAGRPGAYTLTTELANVEVPVTVQAVLAARIDRLEPEDKRLLQTAAVIGRRVPLSLLRCAAELQEDELRERLGRLQATAFLVASVAGPEPVYMFPHALTQEVAYRSVLLGRRRALHAQLVDAMERLYGDRRADEAELLGHHAARGERWAAAVTYLRRAAARAAGRSEYPEAIAFLRESLAAAEHLPPDDERTAVQIDIRFELRNALWARGRLVEGLDHLRQAEPLAVALGDQRRLTRLMAHQSSNYLVLGDNARALERGEQTLSLARKLGDFSLQVDANQFLGVLYTSLGDFPRALRHLDANVGLLGDEQRRGRFGHFYAVHGRTWRVWCLAELGRLDEAAAS